MVPITLRKFISPNRLAKKKKEKVKENRDRVKEHSVHVLNKRRHKKFVATNQVYLCLSVFLISTNEEDYYEL